MADCYIIGAGSFYGLRSRPAEGDLLIAADGGYEYCRKEGLQPDLLLGDFDSIASVPSHPNILQVPVEKDDTDMMLAVKQGLQRGYTRFHLYGGTGGRPDHTVANLQTLLYLQRRGAEGYLYDERFTYTARCGGEIRLQGREGDVFSLFCIGCEVKGLCIEGAQYPLENAALSPDFPLGVSNHFGAEPVKISLQEGDLLLCWQEE